MKKNRFLKLFLLVLLVTFTAIFTISCDGGSSSGGSNPGGIDNPTPDPGEEDIFNTTDTLSEKIEIIFDSTNFKIVYANSCDTEIIFPKGTSDNLTATLSKKFFITETETTYALWLEVYEWATTTGNYTFENPGLRGSNIYNQGRPDTDSNEHPVSSMSWRDAIVWCNALTEYYNFKNNTKYDCVYYTDENYTTIMRSSDTDTIYSTSADKTKYKSAVDSNNGSFDNPYIRSNTPGNTDIENCTAKGFRLPTLTEWEYSARYRGSDSTNTVSATVNGIDFSNPTNGIFYTKGNTASGSTSSSANTAYAVFRDNSNGTAIVKTKLANALGLYDMSGNLCEWCADKDPASPTKKNRPNGAWSQTSGGLPVGFSVSFLPYTINTVTGFRIAKTK